MYKLHCLLGSLLLAAMTATAQQRPTANDTPVVKELQNVEVISTGYQSVARERATGSFVKIDSALFNRRVSANIMDRLQGVVSGMAFNTSTGTLAADISIRGRSTIFSDAQPLIVVDNFPYEGPITNINPNDVLSISILKDAAAASIWGVRAGNGVIVITTRRGQFNRPLKVEFNTNLSFSRKPDLFSTSQMKSTDLIDVEQFLFDKGYYNSSINSSNSPALSPVVEILLKARNLEITPEAARALIDPLRSIDNRNDLLHSYRPSVAQQYAVNLQGGSNSVHYYISAGYDKSQGNTGNTNDRFSLLSQQTFRLASRLQLVTGINYVQTGTQSGRTASNASVYPYERLTDDAGNGVENTGLFSKRFVQQALARGFLDWSKDPMEEARLNTTRRRGSDTRLSLQGRYQLLTGLSLDASYQYEQEQGNNNEFHHQESFFTRNLINTYSQTDAGGYVLDRPIPTGHIVDGGTERSTSESVRLQINFNRDFGAHNITAIAGAEARDRHTTSNDWRLYGFNDDILTSKNVNFDSSFKTIPDGSRKAIPNSPSPGSDLRDRFTSLYGNAAYTYNSRYTISGSIRKDASNFFGANTNRRSIPLWSAGVKWNIFKESFFHVSRVSALSVRATYGFNGNLNKSLTAYTTALYGTNSFNNLIGFITNPPNPDLRWEKVKVINLGIDFGLLENRISGSLEYYTKKGTDLIANAVVDGTTGVLTGALGTAGYQGNVANMKGTGIDLQLFSHNLEGTFQWSTGFLLSYNRDRITRYELIPTKTAMLTTGIAPIIGNPVYSMYAYRWAGLDAAGNPQGYVNGEPSSNYTAATNVTVDQLVFKGPARPRFFGSLKNDFSWRSFEVSVLLTYKLNYVFRSSSISYGALYSRYVSHKDYEQRWQKPGDELVTAVPSMVYPAVSARDALYEFSELLVQRGDQIRLQDIQLSYTLHKLPFRNPGIGRVQFYGYINNIGIVWRANRKGIDPDYPQSVPAPLSGSIGARLSF